MVYDVDLNSDIFYRECPDGVFSCRFCTLQGCEQPLAVVGGNCSVVGFGWQGTELFWNVAGDDVRVVAPCEGDLLVGSDDYEIRIFRKEESIYEISEADKVVALCSLGKRGRFAFGLANGTVGVYKNNERRWRVKSKNALVALLATQSRDVVACVEINPCGPFLGDDVAALAPSSGEDPASPRRRAGVASMAWRWTRRFRINAP